jgi:hypothetical protein
LAKIGEDRLGLANIGGDERNLLEAEIKETLFFCSSYEQYEA